MNRSIAQITIDDVAPELRERIRKMPRPPVSSSVGRWLIRFMTRFFPKKQFEGVQIETRKTAAGNGIRIYTPDQRTDNGAALLWIHGGGLVIGVAAQDDSFCATVSRELGLVVISTEYRLAPENPFPAALDDCLAAWTWVQANAGALNIHPARVAVGGQSAGGGLAASLVQRIYDQGGTQPAAQWLFCPMLDDRTATKRELDAVKHYIWDNRQNLTGWSAYLGDAFGAAHVPEYAVAARRLDLHGLPPAWIGTGDIELFFDENQDYARRLDLAGVPCTLDIVAGAPHGFENICVNTTLAQAYLGRSRAWLAQQLR